MGRKEVEEVAILGDKNDKLKIPHLIGIKKQKISKCVQLGPEVQPLAQLPTSLPTIMSMPPLIPIPKRNQLLYNASKETT